MYGPFTMIQKKKKRKTKQNKTKQKKNRKEYLKKERKKENKDRKKEKKKIKRETGSIVATYWYFVMNDWIIHSDNVQEASKELVFLI